MARFFVVAGMSASIFLGLPAALARRYFMTILKLVIIEFIGMGVGGSKKRFQLSFNDKHCCFWCVLPLAPLPGAVVTVAGEI